MPADQPNPQEPPAAAAEAAEVEKAQVPPVPEDEDAEEAVEQRLLTRSCPCREQLVARNSLPTWIAPSARIPPHSFPPLPCAALCFLVSLTASARHAQARHGRASPAPRALVLRQRTLYRGGCLEARA